MSKFIPALSLHMSPVTKAKEIVHSRLGNIVDDEGNIIDGSWLIDKKDVIQLLEFLDYKAPLLHSTKSLERSAKDMRTALMQIMEAVE